MAGGLRNAHGGLGSQRTNRTGTSQGARPVFFLPVRQAAHDGQARLHFPSTINAHRLHTMIIQRLSARNWRCHEKVDIEFHPLANLLCGRNSRGKTSILKAIAWCLGISTRIGSESDIRNGADETEVTLQIGLNGPSGTVDSHTINRRLNRKGASVIRIDDVKVSVSRALEILTVEWGLPHPEQLAGLIWLKQLRIDALVREDAVSRQERYRALLGFQALRKFNAPLDKLINGYNTAAGNERSLGIDPRELNIEIAAVEKERGDLLQQLGSYPTPEQSRALVAAVRACITRLEHRALQSAVDQALATVPQELNTWLLAAKATIEGSNDAAPADILRIGDYATALNELDKVSRERTSLQKALAAAPTLARLATEDQAISSALLRLEVAAARQAADQAIQTLPDLLSIWVTDIEAEWLSPTATPAPGVERMGDLAAARLNLRKIEAEAERLPSVEQIDRELLGIRGWLVRNAQARATEVADATLAQLPAAAQITTWAKQTRETLAISRTTDRSARSALVTAGVVIERNANARRAVKHNARRAQFVKAIDDAIGSNAPSAEVRAQVRQALKLEADLKSLAAGLQISEQACNGAGSRLREAVRTLPHARLASAVPTNLNSGTDAAQLSPKAEQALRVIWDELKSADNTACPLTGDRFTHSDLETAQRAQTEREARARQSAEWQAFMQKAKAGAPDIAALIEKGETASAIDQIRSAKAAIDDVCTSGLAPATSAFWKDAGRRDQFFTLHEQLKGILAAIPAEAVAWVTARAEAMKTTPVSFLENVRTLEEALVKHGPELPVSDAPFAEAAEAALLSAQDALLAEDSAYAAVEAFVAEHRETQLDNPPVSDAAADQRVRELNGLRSKHQTIATQRSTLTTSVTRLAGTVFSDTAQAARYEPVVAGLESVLDRLPQIYADARVALAAVQKAYQLTDAAKGATVWPVAFGSEPLAVADAKARLAAIGAQRNERMAMEQKCAVAEQTHTRTETTVKNLAVSLFGKQAECPFMDLVTVFRRDHTAAARYNLSAVRTLNAIRAAHEKSCEVARMAPWDASLGVEPATITIAQAQLATLEREASDYSALQGKIAAADQSLLRMRDTIARMEKRAKLVAKVEALRERFKAVQRFLEPENGPRVLMSQEYLDIVARANEVLETIGSDVWLVGNEEFELFTGSSERGDVLIPAEEEGGGRGYLCGITLALGLLEHYNAGSNKSGVHTLLIDEPTLGVEKRLLPSLFRVLTSQGRRANEQCIIVEHDPSGEAYCNKVIRLD